MKQRSRLEFSRYFVWTTINIWRGDEKTFRIKLESSPGFDVKKNSKEVDSWRRFNLIKLIHKRDFLLFVQLSELEARNRGERGRWSCCCACCRRLLLLRRDFINVSHILFSGITHDNLANICKRSATTFNLKYESCNKSIAHLTSPRYYFAWETKPDGRPERKRIAFNCVKQES